MWEFYRNKGDVFLKLILCVFAVMLYMSAAKGISYIMLFFSAMVIFFTPSLKCFDRTAFYLLYFSILYSISLLITSPSIHVLIYLLCPVVFYCFGRFVVSKFDDHVLFDFIAITVFLFGLRTYIATLIDIGEVGLINSSRAMNRSGLGESDFAATLFGLNVSLGFVGLAPFIVKSIKRKGAGILLLASFFLSLITVLHLVNRTGIVVLVLSVGIVLFYSSPKQSVRFIFVGGLLLVVAFLLSPSLQNALYDFLSAYEIRIDRTGDEVISIGDRLWRWKDATRRLFSNPLGWDGKVQYNYVHNLWLDVARLTGIFPFLFIVAATVSGCGRVFRLSFFKKNTIVALFVGLTVAVLASAFVEPVLEGLDLYFYFMCLLWGMVAQYLSDNRAAESHSRTTSLENR